MRAGTATAAAILILAAGIAMLRCHRDLSDDVPWAHSKRPRLNLPHEVNGSSLSSAITKNGQPETTYTSRPPAAFVFLSCSSNPRYPSIPEATLLPEDWQRAISDVADKTASDLIQFLRAREESLGGVPADATADAQLLLSRICLPDGCGSDVAEALRELEWQWRFELLRRLGQETVRSILDSDTVSECALIIPVR